MTAASHRRLAPPPGVPDEPMDPMPVPELLRRPRALLGFVAASFVGGLAWALVPPVSTLLRGRADELSFGWTASLPLVLAVMAVGYAAQAAALLLVPRRPLLGVAASFACLWLLVLATNSVPWHTPAVMLVAAALFLAGTRTGLLQAVLSCLAVNLAHIGLLVVWLADYDPDLAAGAILQFAAPVVALTAAGTALGQWWRAQSLAAARDRAEAEATRREQQQRVAAALDVERARIAQELHDLSAHHLGGMVALVDAVSALAADEPAAALALLRDVRAESRFTAASVYSALSDLRSTGLSAPDLTARTPDAGALDALCARWRTQGMHVDALSLGPVEALPAVVSVTLYRIAQEALANAAKHAPGAAVRVRLLVDEAAATLTVLNAAAPVRATARMEAPLGLGWGLDGARERVRLLDGTLEAAPSADGGWQVRVRIPLDSTPEAG